MASKTWTIQIDGQPHQVSLEHSFWTGSRVISVDGQVVERSRKVIDNGSDHHFEIEGHPCLLRIRPGGMGGAGHTFHLEVGGQPQGEAGPARLADSSPAGNTEATTIPPRNIVAGVFGLIAFMGLYFKTSRPVEGGAVQLFDNLLIGIGTIGALTALFWPSRQGPDPK